MQENDNSSGADVYARELFLHVSEHLVSHVQALTIDVSEEGITLNGVCDSFHSKQLAQEIVSKSTSLRIVANNIFVRDSP
jgi:hypothetical protein